MPPEFTIRTIVIPHRLEPALFRALCDLRRGVNSLLPDWRARPEESRFTATKRVYPFLRRRYPHLASSWCTTMANETAAVLNAWNRTVQRARRHDPERFERLRRALPRRRQLKASLHRTLFRWSTAASSLDITVRADAHVSIDLSSVRHPRFWTYGRAANWHFGLTVRPNALLFHFRVPHELVESSEAVGVDLNFDSADIATSDGTFAQVDLTPITRVQERMVRKRHAIQAHISKDQRHQRAVLRRYTRRETRRVAPLLHRAANELLEKAGARTLVFEDLTDVTETILRREPFRWGASGNRRLSSWTHGRLVEIVRYKAHAPILWVNPEGTSHECPRCGGHLALLSEGREVVSNGRKRMTRQVVCEGCGGGFHRDAAAAIAVLARGCRLLRGATLPPSARTALLEAATWRPTQGGSERRPPTSGPRVEPRKEDDAKSENRLTTVSG